MKGSSLKLERLITDYYQTRSKNNRAIPIEMIDERTSYDVKRYIELLTEACNSVTESFGLKLTSPLLLVSSLQSHPVMSEGSVVSEGCESITGY
jgi:hypothetical protein